MKKNILLCLFIIYLSFSCKKEDHINEVLTRTGGGADITIMSSDQPSATVIFKGSFKSINMGAYKTDEDAYTVILEDIVDGSLKKQLLLKFEKYQVGWVSITGGQFILTSGAVSTVYSVDWIRDPRILNLQLADVNNIISGSFSYPTPYANGTRHIVSGTFYSYRLPDRN